MSTLYLTNASTDRYGLRDSAALDGINTTHVVLALNDQRGSGAVSASQSISVTDQIYEVGGSGGRRAWVSPPLGSAVTISGSITFNMRAMESSMSANVAINCLVQKVDGATGERTTILQTSRTTELGTSESAQNWSETPPSGVDCKKGDRLVLIVYGSGVSSYSFTLYWAGTGSGATGDSWLSTTETLSFVSLPEGTTVYPTVAGVWSQTKSPTVAEQSGSDPWTNPSYAIGSDDNRATYHSTVSDPLSNSLVLRDLSFTLPAGAVPQGVTATVEAKRTDGTASGLNVKLYKNGVVGNAQAVLLNVSGTEYTITVGGPLDLWGNTLTKSDVEATTFGVAVYVSTSSDAVWEVDNVSVTVWYSLGGTDQTREAWTSRGTEASFDAVYTVSGPTSPLLITDSSSSSQTVQWTTRPLEAFTLSGACLVNSRAYESVASTHATLLVEIAVVDGDGSDPVVWASGTLGPSYANELYTYESPANGWLAGDDISVVDGQRLRIRMYADDAGDLTGDCYMVNARFVSVGFNGPTYGQSGDFYFTFAQTLTEFSGSQNLQKTVGDSLSSISDSVSRAAAAKTRTLAETFGSLSESVVGLKLYVRTLGDAVGSLSESVSRAAMAKARTLAETSTGISEAVARSAAAKTRTAAETFGSLSEAVVRTAMAKARTAAETATGISESLARAAANKVRTLSETIALSESVAGLRGFARAVGDTITLSEAAVRTAAAKVRTAAESAASISESVARAAANRVRTAAETFGSLSEAVEAIKSGGQNYLRDAGDTIGSLTETVTRAAIGFARTTSDSITVTEAVVRGAMAKVRTTSETVGSLAETAIRNSATRVRVVADSITASETVSRLAAARRSVADSTTLAEVVAGTKVVARTVAETVSTLTESVSRNAAVKVRTAAETVGSLTETAVRAAIAFIRREHRPGDD